MDDDPNVIGTSAWIERDQFVYFVTMAREPGNPRDPQVLRNELVAALHAAWGIDGTWLHLDANARHDRCVRRISLANAVVEEVRWHHDPASGSDGFLEAHIH